MFFYFSTNHYYSLKYSVKCGHQRYSNLFSLILQRKFFFANAGIHCLKVEILTPK